MFSVRNFLNQLSRDPDCVITTLKFEMIRTDICTLKRNYCFAFRKAEKRYYNNLNERCITDNKLFWKAVKPFVKTRL